MKIRYVQEIEGRLYFRRTTTVDGVESTKRVRLPDLTSPQFAIDYQRLVSAGSKRNSNPDSLDSLIIAYKSSPEFKRLATSSQRNRNYYLELLSTRWGNRPYARLTTGKVYEIRDEFQNTPGKADQLVSTLSSLYTFGMKRDMVSGNPCSKVERLADGEHKAWPQQIIDRASEYASPMLWLGIQAHYYTGQRISDVCTMLRPRESDTLIRVIQKKTGKAVEIPIHRAFREAIREVPANSVLLLYNEHRRQFTPDALRSRLRRLMEEIGEDYTFHGLRKNAVNALLEAGCTTWEVSSITGQTAQLVEEYAKDVNRQKLAFSAVRKWETGTK